MSTYCEDNRNRCGKKPFLGILFILVGIILVLKHMGVIPIDIVHFIFSWKMLLIAIGIANLWGGNRSVGFLFVLIGSIFYIPEFVDVPESIQKYYWPVAFIVGGIFLVFKHRKYHKMRTEGGAYGGFDAYDDFVIFGGREQMIVSQHLRGGRSSALFGGLDYDFTRSLPAGEGAVSEVFIMFGGTTFNIPPDWTVRNEVNTIFGGFSDERYKNPSITSDPSKTLVIRGLCMFGGVSIESKNYPV
ncbi:hypothetical protein EYV94_11235 [Puteibacter caeruleilacunae]|nr:hypothetical protein EYV94_11235 [Puteibacter caeruleilacunae]